MTCRDDVNHKGEKIDWGQWAITGDDPDFDGTGNPDTGEDYGPAPGVCSVCTRALASAHDWQMRRHIAMAAGAPAGVWHQADPALAWKPGLLMATARRWQCKHEPACSTQDDLLCKIPG